ncbi:MAG TPA: hypothetical protein VK548_13105 [Candidatus Acidoferrum sp.]|nr:hypothetical protein [Candidatus Acidoferrum sp.]
MRAFITLAAFRRRGTGGVWFFLLLMLLVAGERRLSEAHFNLRTWTIGLESADALDGDEIRVRLIALNDDKPPSLLDAGRAFAFEVVHATSPRVDRVPLGRPAPRGPPALASAAA